MDGTLREDPVGCSSIDGDDGDAVAICGFSIKFPQDATSPGALWKMIMEKTCAATEFPADRFNVNGFHSDRNTLNSLPLRGGHFIRENLGAFDAQFFSISPTEATAMDPMQRWLLETTYRALENAGITLEAIAGSLSSVYTGSFNLDYMVQLNRDPENPPTYAAVGFGLSMLANRLSWFFDLKGPSIGVDSACSSTAMAIDMACQSLKTGSSNMSIVAGSNLAYSPESYTWMSNINFLSPDSRCYSFDHRANGYARGEGVAVVILKRLADAVRDGNTIRAVIRATGSNEDGRTPGITQPSRKAQEQLIMQTYARSGLSMAHTRYFEAHGTGTPIGDPREAQAIGSAFRQCRRSDDPLYVGAVKSNIGHLEGASGLAGLIKTVMVLEKGIIPPNTNFERLNPSIDAEFLNLKFPQQSRAWPSEGLRRASVSSFGYGGANSHIVIDDAYNYLRIRGIPGRHSTDPYPLVTTEVASNGSASIASNDLSVLPDSRPHRLLVWSAADKDGVRRMASAYSGLHSQARDPNIADHEALCDLAYTLDTHRNHLEWRSYAFLQSWEELHNLPSIMGPPIRIQSKRPRIGYVFTGQGSQWFAMGRELMRYSSFRAGLDAAQSYLTGIGCAWSIIDELLQTESASHCDKPEYSQVLCTVLQMELVDLLWRFNIKPSAVMGHSSGEIAAAYAGGYISRESGWNLAYYRGLCSAELAGSEDGATRGAMMTVELSEEAAEKYIDTMNEHATAYGISIACINSPGNVTIAGEACLIDSLKDELDHHGIFARKLRVPLAYHSHQMDSISTKYKSMIVLLSPAGKKTIPMVSTVTGVPVSANGLLDPCYWAMNMVSPVRFSNALEAMCSQSEVHLVKKIDKSHKQAIVVDYLLELGPHATLKKPILETLARMTRGKSIGYQSILQRGLSAAETLLGAMGELHGIGLPLNLRAVNEPVDGEAATRSLLVDLPEYPFDHSRTYWHESRLSQSYRFRPNPPSELLGVRSVDWNPAEARWRHFIRKSEMPWVEHHAVNGIVVYPGAGMIAMAIEAAKELSGGASTLQGYTLRDVEIEGAIDLSSSHEGVEVQTCLRRLPGRDDLGFTYQFTVRTYLGNDNWLLNCRGFVTAEVKNTQNNWELELSKAQHQTLTRALVLPPRHCWGSVEKDHMYSHLRRCGYQYGPLFQCARDQQFSEKTRRAMATVDLFPHTTGDYVIHPVSLDAILHLSFTALTLGGAQPMATCVPSRIGCLWLSGDGLTWPERDSITAFSTIESKSKRGFSCCGAAIDSGSDRSLRLWYEGVELTNVSEAPSDLVHINPKQYCMGVDCKVALNKLCSQDAFHLLNNIHPPQSHMSDFFRDLEVLVDISLRRLVRQFNDGDTASDQAPWKRKYWHWAKFHTDRCAHNYLSADKYPQTQDTAEGMVLQETIGRLESTNAVGRLYVKVASELLAIFNDEVDPLESLLYGGMLKPYYQELAEYRCSVQISSYLDLLAHQSPGSTILEIGGGTASATRHLVRALRGNDALSALRCNRYDFTDVSAAFLEAASGEFSELHDQMTFRTLDMEKNFAEQGFADGEYDVVVADNVLHVTSNLAQTLIHVRKALKPGGKLMIHELLKPNGWTAGFVFGLFPGWWLGSQDNRHLSPNVDVQAWDNILKSNGFSGCDMVFRDFDDDVAHHVGWLIATAVEESDLPLQPPLEKHKATIVLSPDCPKQVALSRGLFASLAPLGIEPQTTTLTGAVSSIEASAELGLTILLLDYGRSRLRQLDDPTWEGLKAIIPASHHMLWLSVGGGRMNPDHGMLDGFARTLRSEFYDLHLVTLCLEYDSPEDSSAGLVASIVQEMIQRQAHEPYEQEYLEIDQRLHTRRLVEAQTLKRAYEEKLKMTRTVSSTLDHHEAFEITNYRPLFTAGAPLFVKSESLPERLPEGGTVRILVHAVCLQSRDLEAALGHSKHNNIGRFCVGIVVNCGAETKFQAGDRVLVSGTGLLRSHVESSSTSVARIQSDLALSDVCMTAPHAVAAYHAIIEVGRISSRSSVLVHNGASRTGRAALHLLKGRCMEHVWTTVETQEDAALLSRLFDLPMARILPQAWFNSSPMLVSFLRRSFDLILDPQGHSLGRTATEFLVAGGSLVIVRADRGNAGYHQQEVPSALSSASLSVIYLDELVPSQAALLYAATAEPSSRQEDGSSYWPVFPVSALADALGHMRDQNEDQMALVKFDPTDTIEIGVSTDRIPILDPEATYLVVGGFGGIGRAIVRWLANRGARWLVILSRSGVQPGEAQSLVDELVETGTHIEAPRCDVADREALRQTLNRINAAMPPVKGCIQAAMVMTENIFQKLRFEDWEATVKPKVDASWNLHSELGPGLDFFILVSSMMGILGSGSLAAYNAGNTYLDALARYRVHRGENAVAINLGAVPDGGYLVEHSSHLPGMEHVEKYAFTPLRDLLALLELFCNPESSRSPVALGHQAIIGIRPPSHWRHLEEVPATMMQPFWGHMHHVPKLVGAERRTASLDFDDSIDIKRKCGVDRAVELATAGSLNESAEIVTEALIHRVSQSLRIPMDRLEPQKPMHSYGIDSLSAIDLRNWVGKCFDVDMPVFEILGESTFVDAGMSIAKKIPHG
ncbi:putative polyketide synthase [Xylariomycetidae sp. FL0641]|nr:putative polyketide synthase [Xylariomycetidae sp. FL0641]